MPRERHRAGLLNKDRKQHKDSHSLNTANMSSTIAHSAHDNRPDRQVDALQLFLDNPNITCAEWMQQTGLRERSYYDYKRQAFPPAPAPESPAAKPQRTRSRSVAVQSHQPSTDTKQTAIVHGAWRNRILYIIFFAATVASAENMFYTISQFAHDTFSAIALTIVFALTAIGFTAAGMQGEKTIYVIAALVAFEAFCNCTNIYGGLYNFANNTGSAFLMRVQSLFWFLTAKHCATCIAFFAGGCIAAVQYVAIKEIRQPRRRVAVRSAQTAAEE